MKVRTKLVRTMTVRAGAAALLSSGLVAGALTATASGAAAAPARTVNVTNSGYQPATLTAPYGSKVNWLFKQGTHTVTDATRLGLFSSGTKAQGSSYAFTFINSGTFPYRSKVGTAITGTVAVPMTATPGTGTRNMLYAIRWGSDYTPEGYSEQIELKEPGSSRWESFVFGTPVSNATMRPVDWGNKTGTYSFRAKLYKGSTPGVSSGWSPLATISVH